jgi:hypothetical protein
MSGGEDRLRRALDDLAPRPSADDAAFAGLERAVARRRRRTAVARVAAAVALVGVAAGGAALARSVGDAGDRPADVATPAQQGGDEGGTGGLSTLRTTVPGPERARIGNATFVVPEGWEATPLGSGDAVCVAPVGNPEPRWEDCGGLAIYHGDLPGTEGRPYERDAEWSFDHGTDATPCPFAAPGVAPGNDIVEPGQAGRSPIDGGLRPVGDRKADYNQWFARCSVSHRTFTPRAWLLPKSRILILDVLGQPGAEAILASFDFSGTGG